jgi:beta-glucosidase
MDRRVIATVIEPLRKNIRIRSKGNGMRTFLLALPLLAVCGGAVAQNTPLFRDPSQPIDTRISDLVGRLTLEEKASQLNHLNTGVPRLGLPMWGGWNQTLHGVWSKEPTTLFPAAIAMGATWDPDLVHTITGAMSDEARALYNAQADGPRSKHGLVYRSPVINISRDPRWGRIQEVFSEDPYLTGRMAVAYVTGLQGDDINHLKVASTLKHFAVNNVEHGRQHGNAVVDDRNLMDFFLPHWKAGIMEGHAQSVMSSYNAINGTPGAINHHLLTDILRGQWGFDGFVTDDLGAVSLLTADRPNEPGQRFSEDPVVSAAAAIKAGNDSDDSDFQTNIPLAVTRGLLSETDVNQALSRVLRVGFRLGAFDPPGSSPYATIGRNVVRSPEHLALSLKTAQEAITLLSNRNRFLPLDRARIHAVAVIGPAGEGDYETGNYYGTPAKKLGALEGVRDLLGPGVSVQYEKGAGFIESADPAAMARATDLARKSDVAILCLGTNLQVENEGRDRRDLNLPGAQHQLMEAVFAANPKTVLVLMNAGPVADGWAQDRLPAIMEAWYPGEAGGTAIARALFGDDNPGGHLPYTVYANLDGVPPQHEYDVSKGYTYQYFKGVPLYAFGHGLSYTRFTYSHVTLSAPSVSDTGTVQVSFDITNAGDRAGSDVAQLYTHQVESVTYQPISTLRAFRRVQLAPGESRHISFTLPAAQLGYYQTAKKGFAVEPGDFDLGIGSASNDIRLRAHLTVTGGKKN